MRTVREIVHDIEASWEVIPIPARFYLEDLQNMTAMDELVTSHTVLIKEFLENSDMWQGATADYLKAELREMIQ